MAFDAEHLQKMESGIRCFNQQQYWECHEELEHVWLEDRQDPHRYVYWAVIQVAASMIHYRDDKFIGAVGMMNKAREKFKKCRELHVLSPLLEEKLQWSKLEAMVMAIPEKPEDLKLFEVIWNFRFKCFED
ncbi:MAG: DUF309 domain-containing protein [Bacteriovoracaceae bacterium]|nr:DUF309 domain-containing protein [Bacteriovoracaceae bacterium]